MHPRLDAVGHRTGDSLRRAGKPRSPFRVKATPTRRAAPARPPVGTKRHRVRRMRLSRRRPSRATTSVWSRPATSLQRPARTARAASTESHAPVHAPV